MIERIACRLGVVPRAVRNATWMVGASCAVAALCVGVDSMKYSASILVLLLAFPLRMRPSSRAWMSQGGTEWMLASGAWTRAMLARSTVFEILVMAASGTGALAVIAMAHAIAVPEGVVRSSIFFAAAVVSFQGFTAVIANWNSSSRVHPRAQLPRIKNPEIASPLRIVFLVAWIGSLGSLAATKGRPMWVVPTGALMLIATYWLVSGAELSAKSEGRERSDERRRVISVRPFVASRGLLWEGSRPSARWLAVFAPALAIVASLGQVLGWHVDMYILHMLSMGVFSWAAASPFRWASRGGQSEFLCTSGVLLRDARRLELVAGVFFGLEMLAVGWLINLSSSISVQGCLMYAIAFGLVLLVSNQSRLPPAFGPGMRVSRLLPWGLLVAIVLVIALTIISIATAREPRWMFPACAGILVAIGLIAPIGFWIWAFFRAGDDERLRRDELEPKLYLVARR